MKKIETRVIRILKELESLKFEQDNLYRELNLYMPRVLAFKKKLKKIKIVDNFKNKNVVYRTTSVSRYTIEEV